MVEQNTVSGRCARRPWATPRVILSEVSEGTQAKDSSHAVHDVHTTTATGSLPS